MSQFLELPDPLYDSLKRAAEASGTTPAGWIAAHLPSAPGPEPAGRPKTLAELLKGRVGRIHSGGKEVLSEKCGERFTAHLEQKRREGHL
jgi:hypothetical protein